MSRLVLCLIGVVSLSAVARGQTNHLCVGALGVTRAFEDGFENASQLSDLFPSDGSRWTQLFVTGEGGFVELTGERVRSGQQALKLAANATLAGGTLTKATLQKNNLCFTNADDFWFSGWYYLMPAASLDGVYIWDIESATAPWPDTSNLQHPDRFLFASPGRRVQFLPQDLLSIQSKGFGAGLTNYVQPAASAIPFPQGQWVHLIVHMRLSGLDDGQGLTEVWQDGRKIIGASGQNFPYGVHAVYNSQEVGFSANASAVARVMYIDDIAISDAPVDAAVQGTTYRGTGMAVHAAAAGTTTTISKVMLPNWGDPQQSSRLDVSVPGVVTGRVAHTSAAGSGNQTRTDASLSGISIPLAGNTIAADFAATHAVASCTSMSASVSGGASIADLLVNGISVPVTGEPNQIIPLPGGRLIVNEQALLVNGLQADMTVRAMRVMVDGLADIVIGSATAGITCVADAPPTPAGFDFLSGSGWIDGTPSGGKAHFGVAGASQHGNVWGHLTFWDQQAGIRFRAVTVDRYLLIGEKTRRIEGTGTLESGVPVSYSADVVDDGDADSFAITMSNGYNASGALRAGHVRIRRASS